MKDTERNYKICKLDEDVARERIRLNDGDMHLSKEDTTLYLKQLEDLMAAKKLDLQADVALKKLNPQHVPTILDQYRIRILDKLNFETGIEEEDL